MHKNVTVERHTFTKAEREYIRGIIHNLSFQRLTDQEIAQWLHDEKNIDLDRSTVSKMRNQIEKQAEKWYIDLRNSAYRYLAQYKERIDSLLSYQRTLHEIISTTKREDIKIRAISELHSIEMDILSLWKQLPASNVVNTVDNTENEKKVQWAVQIGGGEEEKIPISLRPPLPSVDGPEVESEAWTVDNHDKDKDKDKDQYNHDDDNNHDAEPQYQYNRKIANIVVEKDTEQEQEQHQKTTEDKDTIDLDVLGRYPRPFDIEPWIQCNFGQCTKWFKNADLRTKHLAKYHTGRNEEIQSAQVDETETEPSKTHSHSHSHATPARRFTRTLMD